MTIEEARSFYGSYVALARALNMSRQAIFAWKRRGQIPLQHQHMLEKLTQGELTVSLDDTHYKEGK